MSGLLAVRDLRVAFADPDGRPTAVLRGLDLDLAPGESLALTGASGSGKSLTARAVLGLLPREARMSGRVIWRGRDLAAGDPQAWASVRGGGMTLIPQEPVGGLHPVLTVGDQVAEAVRLHQGVGRHEATRRTVDLLAEVKVPEPTRRADWYPHQLSGGMRQRVLLAAALACNPALLIADEPTTSLDVTVQLEIVRLIDRVRRDRGMALLFISHDLDLVRVVARRRAHLAQGRLAEKLADGRDGDRGPGTVVHPVPEDSSHTQPILAGCGLTADYGRSRTGGSGPGVPPLADVDIALIAGSAVGLTGESGCGKTTLARVLAGHLPLRSGTLAVGGIPHVGFTGRAGRRRRRQVQLLFQDAGASLNLRQCVGDALIEAGTARDGLSRLLAEVGLGADVATRFPHELSGGQRQRVALARCLAVEPVVLIADEPTSALDPGARDRVLALLLAAMEVRRLSVLLISHDFSVLERLCGHIVIMRSGMVVESYATGTAAAPRHPYARDLLAAQPVNLDPDPERWPPSRAVSQSSPVAAGPGCPLAGRCSLQKPQCFNVLPSLREVAPGHLLRCPEA